MSIARPFSAPSSAERAPLYFALELVSRAPVPWHPQYFLKNFGTTDFTPSFAKASEGKDYHKISHFWFGFSHEDMV